jgi:hypothetical protein
MLPFGVTIPVTVPQRSKIPEGLMNNPVYGREKNYTGCPCLYILQEPLFTVVYRMNNKCTFYTHLKCGF